MSAIAGILHFNNEPIPTEHGRGLMEALQKFPADDVQTWQKDKVFLGCHAQWITPESVGEQLPYYDYERQLAITADAIIDNREELFEKLQIDYEDRKTITDSELILFTYQKWGEDAPKFLIGDFAFMIWDEKVNKLFGARDFSGNRTLYYHLTHHRFSFCTVIEPLLTLPFVNKELNEQWLSEFLAIPGVNDTVDASSTPYKGILQVAPSHSIRIVEGKVTNTRYCRLNFEEKLILKSNEEYIEAFRDVFHKAVSEQMRTRHKVGARLSGGLDSGSVVSFAAKSLKRRNKTLHTYSYVPIKDFQDWTPKRRIADERPFIESTVKFVGNIKEHYLDFEGMSPVSEIDSWLELMEMPYKTLVNSFWLKGIYEIAQQDGIGILLSGGRGNYSISWGPAIDYYAMLLKKLRLIHLNKELSLYSRNIGSGRKHVLSVVGKRAFPFMSKYFSPKVQTQFPMLINPEFAMRTDVFGRLLSKGIDVNSSPSGNNLEFRKQHFERDFSWNLKGISRTKASLKYLMWDRDPTNDLRVVKFCLAAPYEQFVQNGLDRALIRRATENYLPDKVRLNQRIKGIQGADSVLRMKPSWNLFVDEIRQLIQDTLVAEYLNIKVVKDALKDLREDPREEHVYNDSFIVLIRSLVFYRFIKQFN